LLEPSYLINVRMDCLFVFNENVIGIIIINPGSRYERLSIEWPFNYAPNLRGVGLIIPGAQEKTGPVRDCTQEWSETVVSLLNRGLGPSPNTRLDTSKPNRGLGTVVSRPIVGSGKDTSRRTSPHPTRGWIRTHPGPTRVGRGCVHAQQGVGHSHPPPQLKVRHWEIYNLILGYDFCLGAVTSRPIVGSGADASRPNRGVGHNYPLLNIELGTEKDIISSWVMTFVCCLLNGVDLRNHDPLVALQVCSFLEKWGDLRLKRFLTNLSSVMTLVRVSFMLPLLGPY
jgi:hypothetical protein